MRSIRGTVKLSDRPTALRRLDGYLHTTFSMVAGVALILELALFATWYYSDLPPTPKEGWRSGIGVELFQGSRFQPEPGERMVFVVGCLSFPLVALAVIAWFRFARISPAVKLSLAWVGGFAWLGLIHFWSRVTLPERGILWSSSSAFVVPALFTTAAVCATVLSVRKLSKHAAYEWLANTLAVIGCALLALYHISPGEMSTYSTTHLEPILFPMTQVVQGRTLLVDAQSMYGLYPHFLEPIFHVTPLTMSSFSAVMAALLFLTLFLIYRFLRLTTPGPLIAWIGFLGYLLGPFTTLNSGDPYYQCYPIRTIFPALVLWLGAGYIQRPGRLRFLALAFLAGLALLWNVDSGIACVGGMVAVVVGRCLATRDLWHQRVALAIKEGGASLLVAGCAVGLMFAYLAVRSGETPQWGDLFAFQRHFYGVGFLMEPIKPGGAWWLLLLLYMAAMTSGLAVLFGYGCRRLAPIYLLLSILGTGLFAYYQGRSVLANLYYAAWPAILILAVYFGEAVRRSRTWLWRPSSPLDWCLNTVQFGRMATTAFALCLLIVTMVCCRQRIGTTVTWDQYRASYDQFKKEWYHRVSPVHASLVGQDPHAPVLVLSARDHFWHLFLDRPSALGNAGFNHMFRVQDIDDICQLLEERQASCVVWDEAYLQAPHPATGYGYVTPAEKARFLNVLRRRYQLATIAAGPNELAYSVWVIPKRETMILAFEPDESWLR